MKEYLEKVDSCYKSILSTGMSIKDNYKSVSPDFLVLSMLEAKGIFTKEEIKSIFEYIGYI